MELQWIIRGTSRLVTITKEFLKANGNCNAKIHPGVVSYWGHSITFTTLCCGDL